jgi:hypothetical protein
MQTFQILFFNKRYYFVNKLFLYLSSINRTIIGDSEFQSFVEQSFKWSQKISLRLGLGIFLCYQESDLVKVREVLPEKWCRCQSHIMRGMQDRVLILALNSSLPKDDPSLTKKLTCCPLASVTFILSYYIKYAVRNNDVCREGTRNPIERKCRPSPRKAAMCSSRFLLL